ncbi:fumarylacetoacetate hydrolase family protein [bacterium]|nr:fumarylacetoacetate hydrolase family protein [bacterium]
MKIARFEYQNETRQGIVEGQEIELLALADQSRTGQVVKLSEGRLLAPVCPPNVIALGLNYRKHAVESQMKLPERPLMFLKATTSVIGPNDPIVLPHMAPTEVDYEAELCLVIGKTARNVSEAEALEYVMGYTCGNDVSARDCQIRLDGGQWARGKSFDSFCPLGPWIETELDPDNVAIGSRLNGQVMQASNTSDLIFNCRQLVSYLSHSLTLLPGTVIMTGTPEGVGFVRQPPVYMQAGDVIEIEIEGIGVLRNPVVADCR